MSLKYSLRDLFIIVAVVSVACAALVNTGIWWHSIIVTVTLLGMTGLLIWGTLHPGPRRAFASGWLMFAAAYLALVFGPWTGNSLGGNFITSKCLSHLEQTFRRDNPSPAVLYDGQQGLFSVSDLNLGSGRFLPFTSTGWASYPPISVWDSFGSNWADSCTTFQSTGHWLFASAFGYCGAHLAVFLYLRGEAAKTQINQA